MGRGINQRALLFLQAVVGVFFRAAAAGAAVGVAHFQLSVADEVGVAAAVVVKVNQGFVVALAVAAGDGFGFGIGFFKEQCSQGVMAVGGEFERGFYAGAAGAGQYAFVGADEGGRGACLAGAGSGFGGVRFGFIAGGEGEHGESEEEG